MERGRTAMVFFCCRCSWCIDRDYPELAQERMKELYEQKGYPKDWIDKRLRGIAIRQSLTDEWKERGITEKSDYAILTAEFLKQRLD